MTIQAQFDADALNQLPIVLDVIASADRKTANEMRLYVLRKLMNHRISLDEMNNEQKINVQKGFIEVFKFKEWL